MKDDRCDLCGSEMIHILKKTTAVGITLPENQHDVTDYCPHCDKDLIPEEFRYMTQREISMLELKKELMEKFEPVVKKIESFILWLEKPLQWMAKHQIRIYQAFVIVMIILCLFSYHLSKSSLNLAKKIRNDNVELIQANESLIESNDELLRINQTLIIYLYHNYDPSSHSLTDEILDSVFNKADHLEDSI